MSKKVVLAYSGGLDTSVAVAWLVERGFEVICVCVDVGQGLNQSQLRTRAMAAGASEVIFIDSLYEYCEQIISRAIKANALYEKRYPLVSALSRPQIVKDLVEVANEYDCDAIAHGCTGKGNDQVRFELGISALRPETEIIAPARSWDMDRDKAISFAKAHQIPIETTKDKIYSIDENIFGRAIECGELEDPFNRPPEDVWELTALKEADQLELLISFEKGLPVAVDGHRLELPGLLNYLNDKVGSRGVGRIDMVENRAVGIKSREVYEAPGALAIIEAHVDLEALTLERELAHEKNRLESRYSELVYEGRWFSPLREALDEFFEYTQEYVNGDVRMQVGPHYLQINGRKSPNSLYDFGLATYDKNDSFKHSAAEGFLHISSLPYRVWARSKRGNEN